MEEEAWKLIGLEGHVQGTGRDFQWMKVGCSDGIYEFFVGLPFC